MSVVNLVVQVVLCVLVEEGAFVTVINCLCTTLQLVGLSTAGVVSTHWPPLQTPRRGVTVTVTAQIVEE